MVVETARNYGRVYQTGAQRLSEANHVFAIEMARTGRLGKIHTAYADIRWRDGMRRDWLPAEPEPPKDELDWEAWIGPCPWRPYNRGYVNGGGWYHFYDFATDVAMWGAHTVAQVLPGLDMSSVSSIEFQYDSPDGAMVTRFSNGVKMVLRVAAIAITGTGLAASGSTVPRAGLRRPTVIQDPTSHRRRCWPNTRRSWMSTWPGRSVPCIICGISSTA